MEEKTEVALLREKVKELEKQCAIYKGKLQEKALVEAIKHADKIYPWHYHIINELTGMGIWQLSLASEELIWSDMTYRLFGFEPGVLDPNDIWESTVYPEDRKNIDLAIYKAVENDDVFNSEMRVRWPDGSVHYLGGSGIVIKENDQPLYVIGVNWDMTQNWEKSETIKFYDDLVNGVMEASKIGVFWTMNHRIISEFEGLPIVGELLDISYNENQMYNARDVFNRIWYTVRKHPQYKKSIQAALKNYALLNKGLIDHTSSTFPVIHNDGTMVWVEVKMYVKFYDESDDKRLTGTLIEITDVKNLEFLNARNEAELEKTIQALEKSKRRADSSSEAKSLFLANMSHEIRTPLNAIIGLSYLLKDSVLDSMQMDYVKSIESASHNLSSIVSDILDFSKIEAGELALDVVDFEIALVIEHVRTLMLMKREHKNSHVELVFEVDDRIPAHVKGDPLRLGQIIINLGTNAVKFTEEGYVKVKVTLVHQKGKKLRLSFVVEDTGIGIDVEDLKRLFRTFQQADSSTTRKYGGTGLGLAISKNLVALMGGSIEVDSCLGKGSRFRFEIDVEAIEGDPTLKTSDDIVNGFEGKMGNKILIVEDNELNQKVVIELLKKVGLKTIVAENGKEAMEIIGMGSCVFDLILMDLQMPEMDGYTTTSMIRQKVVYKYVPIVVMTADVTYGVKNKIMQMGANDYIAKPVDAYRFYRTIDRWLKEK